MLKMARPDEGHRSGRLRRLRLNRTSPEAGKGQDAKGQSDAHGVAADDHHTNAEPQTNIVSS